MYRPSKPSAYLVASTKLQHEWSANRCVPHISTDWTDELLADPSFGQMHSMVKVRLLLAGLLALDKAPELSPGARAAAAAAQHAANRAELRSALERLRDAVSGDADEWDKVMAAAAGPMDGRLDLESVKQRSPAVQESMTHLEQLVAASTNQQLITPLEDEFLRDPPSVLDPEGAHFVVRPHARVQPLSAGFNYTQATPPPPSLLQAQGVHASTAGAQAAAGQRVPQARLQQGDAAAASGLFRAKARQLEQQSRAVVVVTPEEGAADLFKNTHQKYGVASAVRHEQVVHTKAEGDQKQQQQQQLRRQQQQWHLQQQQQQEAQRPKGTFFNIYGNKPAAGAATSTPPPAAAGPSSVQDRARQRQRDADIDDLFDDDCFIDDRPIEHIVAPSGGSRTARHLVHKVSARRRAAQQQEEDEHEKTPDDLFDDMDADNGGDGDGEQMGQQQQQEHGEEEVGAEEVVSADGGGGAGEGVDQQASAVKRRRMHVIASDSEDDD